MRWRAPSLAWASFLLLAPPATAAQIDLGQGLPDATVSAPPTGTLLQASLELGLVERDVYALSSPGVGWISPRLELLLVVPIELRVWDLPPPDPGDTLGGVLRRRTYARGGEFHWTNLSMALARLRLGAADDPIQLRAGRVRHSLGHGSTLWQFTSSPDPDRRHAGAVLQAGGDAAGVELTVGEVLAPQQVSAARAYLRPLLIPAEERSAMWEVGRRLALGFGYAADLSAPTRTEPLPGPTAQLVHATVDLEVVLLQHRWLAAALYSDAGLRTLQGRFGVGDESGLLLSSHLGWLGTALRLGARFCGPRYRPAEFDAFYQIERGGRLRDGAPLATVTPEPGLGWVAEAQVTLASHLQLRLQADARPGRAGGNALLGLDLLAGPLRAALMVTQRDLDALAELLVLDRGTIAAAEVRCEIVGPLALVGRYWRTLRRDAATSQRLDDDLLLGVEVGWVLQ